MHLHYKWSLAAKQPVELDKNNVHKDFLLLQIDLEVSNLVYVCGIFH